MSALGFGAQPKRYERIVYQPPIAVRVTKIWPILSQASDMLGTAFLCVSLEGEVLEGRLSRDLAVTSPNILSVGGIYQFLDYMVFPNSYKYKVAPHPNMIRIDYEASVIKINHPIPYFPMQPFSPHNFMQLIGSANTRTYLPGQIRIMQNVNCDHPESKANLIVGLLLDRFTMVKLTLRDSEASVFRHLQKKSNRKYQVVLVTSIVPSICEGKLLLASSPATLFFFDTKIKHITVSVDSEAE